MSKLLHNAKIIVGIYLGLKTSQVAYSALIVHESTYLLSARVLALIIPAIFAMFAFKNNQPAQWLVAIIILIGGITGAVSGVIVPLSQYVLKALFIVFGLYLTIGGIILIKKTKNKWSWA